MKTLRCTLAAITLLPSLAVADISFSQSLKIEAAGAMSMFGTEGDIVTNLSADRSRSETDMRVSSTLARVAGAGGKSGTIVRLDKGIIQTLYPEKKQYTEMTLDDMRRQMDSAIAQSENAQSGTLPVSSEDCEWSPGDLEVESERGTVKVADIKTKQHTIRLRQQCVDKSSGKSCDLTWVMEVWLAKKVPGNKTIEQYTEGYAEAMGLDSMDLHLSNHARGLIAMFGENWNEVGDAFDDLKGYPLRTALQMGIGGEQCTTATGQPIALDDMWADASTAAYNAALDQAGYEAGNAVGRAAGEAVGGSVAGSIGGAAIGAAAGEMIGGLTGMFKKKKKKDQPAPQPASPGGRQVTVFRIETEVTRWSEVTVPDERFELDGSWKQR